MKSIFIVFFVFISLYKANARQTRAEAIRPFQENPIYRIGEVIPDFGNLKLVNADQIMIKLSDFKDGLVILDFWARSCHSCIEEMPHMDALQQQFGTKVKILPVTAENANDIASFWKSNKYLKSLTLPSVVEDKILWSYFKFAALGEHVWIYKGKVIGITYPEYVDAYNINQVLAGNTPNWPVRNDFYKIDGNKEALFKDKLLHSGSNNRFEKYVDTGSYRYINGIDIQSEATKSNFGIVRDSGHKTVRAYIINEPIFLIYIRRWVDIVSFQDLVKPVTAINNTVVWEVTDRSKYKYDYENRKSLGYEGDWMRKNAICFESVYVDKGQTDQEVIKSVIKGLDSLLGLHVRWKKRKEKVLVLVSTSKNNQFLKEEDVPESRRLYVSSVSGAMNNQRFNPYVFDETNYNGQGVMDVRITDWTDVAAIRKAIAPYGLALKEEMRLVDKFVFTEVNRGLLNK